MSEGERVFYLQQELVRIGNAHLRGLVTEDEWRQRAGLLLRWLGRLRPGGRAG